jgi:DNA (cytosine-5)-methyltransferase 1
MREIIVDLFAGGGGFTQGAEEALGMSVDIAVNHDPDAIEMHKTNHPATEHYTEDVFKVNPWKAVAGRKVGLLLAAPDCTHHSRAKGGKPVSNKRRGLAWVVVKWAKAVRPRIIILENVPEFREWGPLTKDDLPDPAKKRMTFNLWANQLRGLGYKVEHRVLCAADYGAPTIRKRLFVVARCDGQPIVWPDATHGAEAGLFSLKPYRTAAECIDFDLPCPSIFERKKPLAEATLRRIAKGIQKYVIEAQEPFIVRTGHYSNITGKGSHFRGQGLDKPLATITSINDKALVMPTLVGIDNQSSQSGTWKADEPLRTITLENRFAIVAAMLSKYHGQKASESRCHSPAEPMRVLDTQNRVSLVAAHPTKFYGTSIGSDLRQPVPTITGKGQHIAEVRAFLVKYYGCGVGQSVKEAMHTVTTKDRIGLVTVAGIDYAIADIGLRMLTPRELARAQGFPESYILTGTKTNQVAKIGNSVCPPVARALVAANVKIKESENVKAG